MQFSIVPSELIAFVRETEGKPRHPSLFPNSRDCTVVLTVVGGYGHEGQATNARPTRMAPKETTYGTPRWHDMDHAFGASIESLRLRQMDSSLFLFSSPVELPSFYIRRICELRQMVWFDVGVITYDVD